MKITEGRDPFPLRSSLARSASKRLKTAARGQWLEFLWQFAAARRDKLSGISCNGVQPRANSNHCNSDIVSIPGDECTLTYARSVRREAKEHVEHGALNSRHRDKIARLALRLVARIPEAFPCKQALTS